MEEIARQTGGVLIAAVVDPPNPILPAKARAELAAALAVVDYVVTVGGSVEDVLRRIGADHVYREESADRRRSEDLMSRVRKVTETC